MEPSSETAVPAFKILGVEIPLNAIELPDKITITHSIPEEFKGLSLQREIRRQCDITIIIGEKELRGHKVLLSARIPYFKALFNSNMAECEKGEIDMSNDFCEFERSTFERLFDYAYTGHLKICTGDVQDLMLGASFLDMESVMDECALFMKRRISFDSVLTLLSFFKSIAYDKINSAVLSFIDKNFVPLSLTEEFLNLELAELVELLRRDTLYVDKEIQVFEAVSRWIEFGPERRQHAAKLLKTVRCTQLTDLFITDTVQMQDWVKDDPECIALVNEAKEYINRKDPRKQPHSFKTLRRDCDYAHNLFISIPELFENEDPTVTPLQIYNPMTNTWTKTEVYRTSNRAMEYFHRNIAGAKIYINCGLLQGPISCETLDVISNQWSTEPDIGWPVKRLFFAAYACIDDAAYVAGGEDDIGDAVSLHERFDTISREWTTLTPMLKPRIYATGCSFGGKFYVIGGFDGSHTLYGGECYDPISDSWTRICSMNFKRERAGAVALKGHIYVFGGSDGDKNLRNVERYDPASDTWETRRSMTSSRQVLAHFSYAVSCGKLFVFGGFTGLQKNSIVKTVEMYDPETDTWEAREPMPFGKCCCLPLLVPATFPSMTANIEGIWINGFRKFHIKDELIKAFVECGIMNPREVQSECIPQVILGNDVMCKAESGAGKTATFVMGTLQQLDPIDGEISVLVLCPTRDIAYEIERGYARFSKYLPSAKTSVIVDGTSMKRNHEGIERISLNIIIGTPARILKLATTGALKVDKIKHLILDDCDKMIGDSVCTMALRTRSNNNPKNTSKSILTLKKIFDLTPKQKQVMIFSETLPEKLRDLSENILREEPFRFQLISHK